MGYNDGSTQRNFIGINAYECFKKKDLKLVT